MCPVGRQPLLGPSEAIRSKLAPGLEVMTKSSAPPNTMASTLASISKVIAIVASPRAGVLKISAEVER
jgi:hypothetical protein